MAVELMLKLRVPRKLPQVPPLRSNVISKHFSLVPRLPVVPGLASRVAIVQVPAHGPPLLAAPPALAEPPTLVLAPPSPALLAAGEPLAPPAPAFALPAAPPSAAFATPAAPACAANALPAAPPLPLELAGAPPPPVLAVPPLPDAAFSAAETAPAWDDVCGLPRGSVLRRAGAPASPIGTESCAVAHDNTAKAKSTPTRVTPRTEVATAARWLSGGRPV